MVKEIKHMEFAGKRLQALDSLVRSNIIPSGLNLL
jgi:hypothetical protein